MILLCVANITLRSASNKYKNVEFVELDIDTISEGAQYLRIIAVPTFVLYKGREKVGEVLGADKGILDTAIETALLDASTESQVGGGGSNPQPLLAAG
jgi:hypothetical protein